MASRYPLDLIRCAICLGEQTSPRALPCLHSFCEICLTNHIQTCSQLPSNGNTSRYPRSDGSFPCPACRKPTRMPENRVEGFPRDFRITEFKEVCKTSKGPNSYHIPTCDMCMENTPPRPGESYCVDCCKYFCIQCCSQHKAKSVLNSHIMVPIMKNLTVSHTRKNYCIHHQAETVKFYCETCSQRICVKCLFGNHGNHTVKDIATTLTSKRNDLKYCIKHIYDQMWILQDMLFNLTCLEGRIKGRYEETKLQLKKSSRKLVNKLFGAEVKLLCELDETYQKQTEDVYKHKQLCQNHLDQFKSLQLRLDGILKVEDIDKVLENYADILNEVREINISKQYKSKFFKFPEYVEFVPNGSVSLGKLTLVSNENFKHERSSSRNRLTKSARKYQDQPKSVTSLGSKTGALSSPWTSGRERSSGKQFLVKQETYTGTSTSNHLEFKGFNLAANHYDPERYNDITPLNSECIPSPRLLYKVNTPGAGKGQISMPFSATFDKENHLVVAENGNGRLQIFGDHGHSTKIIRLPHCVPRCVTTTADSKEFAITDEESKNVKIVNNNGNVVKDINTSMESFPFGITMIDEDKFAISDIIYECIWIVSASDKQEVRFGSQANMMVILDNPSYLTVNIYGNILVSDSGHHEIKVFDKLGNFLYKFGSYGTGLGQLRYPKGIACDKNGLVYVADSGNDRVVVFSEVGIYCGVLIGRESGIKRPTGLAYSPKDLLAITMPDSDEVCVYELTNPLPRSSNN